MDQEFSVTSPNTKWYALAAVAAICAVLVFAVKISEKKQVEKAKSSPVAQTLKKLEEHRQASMAATADK